MPEKVMPGPVEDLSGIREAVCIHTRKVYDSCREKDTTPLRFYQEGGHLPSLSHITTYS